jgi:hypothetical protein
MMRGGKAKLAAKTRVQRRKRVFVLVVEGARFFEAPSEIRSNHVHFVLRSSWMFGVSSPNGFSLRLIFVLVSCVF